MVKKFIKAGHDDYNSIFFSWQLIDKCQYNCTYCSSVNYNLNTFDKKNLKVWKPFIKMLHTKRLGISFTIELLGGEPTIHPDIHEIIKELSNNKNCTSIDMITNLAKPFNFYKKFYSEESKNKLRLITSYHPEYHNTSFTEKIIKLHNLGMDVNPSINLHDKPQLWGKTMLTINTLKKNNIHIDVNLLFEVEDGINKGYKPNYTDEFFKKFDNILKNDKLNTPCRLNEKASPLKSSKQCDDDISSNLTTGHENIPYQDEAGKYYYTEKEIVVNDYAKFKGWNCKPMIYNVNMDCIIENGCTGERISLLELTKKNLTKCVKCPLERCDCSTKFLFPKYIDNIK